MRAAALVVLVVAAAPLPAAAWGQSHARLDVPPAAMDSVLRANRDGFEKLWNDLLVDWLRASLTGAKSGAHLAALAERVAAAEPAALGSHIAADALQLFRSAPRAHVENRVRAAVAESLGTAARGEGDPDQAEAHFQAALADYRQVGESRRIAWVVGSLGAVALDNGLYGKADTLFQQALTARRTLGDERMVGNTLYDLAQIHYQLDRLDEARRELEESRRIREQTGQTAQLGSTLQFLGATLAKLGEPDSAWVCFESGLERTSAAGDSARTLDALINYASALTNYGFREHAITLSQRALVIAQGPRFQAKRAKLELNMAEALRGFGRYSEALEHAQTSIDVLRSLDLPADLANALNSLGRLWLVMGVPRPARAPLDLARVLVDSLGQPALQARVRVNLSWAAQLEGDPERSRRHGTRALAMASSAGDSQLVRDACVQLGDLAFSRGDLGVAEQLVQRAIQCVPEERSEYHAYLLTQLAEIRQHGGRLDEAERDLREALTVADRIGNPEVASSAWLNLGDIAERRGSFSTALERYERARDQIDTVRARQHSEERSITAYASRLGPYESIIHLLGKLDRAFPDSGYAARAFDWAERARARALLDRTAGTDLGAPKLVTIAEAQALLPTPRSALLYYSIGDSSTSLWVILPGTWRHVRLAPRRELAALVGAVRAGIVQGGGAPAPYLDPSVRLYRALVAPAESLLAGVDELVISPDGPLSRLPFEALRTPTVRSSGTRYLVQRFAVSYTPSASLLQALGRGAPDSTIIAVGAPDFGSGGVPAAALRAVGGLIDAAQPAPSSSVAAGSVSLAPLPGTARELRALQSIASGRRVVALEGREATRSRLLALPELPSAAIIHIATHGVAHELEPARSGLWLAAEPPSGSPSFLSVPEVSRLHLRASLVTLSACETGLGTIERGEGVIGLARVFLAAGARSVVVSQWRVADRATAVLMERFYRGLLLEGRSRAQALAEAKRALLRNQTTCAPKLWAPFVLIGRSGPLE